MDLKLVRVIALWTAICTGLMNCGSSLLFQCLYWIGAWSTTPVLNDVNIPGAILQLVTALTLFGNTVHMVSLLVFLALVQKDLTSAERWAEHARNYLNRDLISGSSPAPDSDTVRI